MVVKLAHTAMIVGESINLKKNSKQKDGHMTAKQAKRNWENRGTFTQIPNIIFDTCDLPERAQILFLRLYRHVRHKDGKFQGSLRKLSNLVRIPKSTTATMIKQLEDANLITISYETGTEQVRATMVIKINIDELWGLNRYHSEIEPLPRWKDRLPEMPTTPDEPEDREAKELKKPRLTELQTMPYPEYLQSPEWAAKRSKALRFANYRCQLCNGNETLTVHHRTYERRGHELMGDLIVLCKDCHDTFTYNRELVQR